MNFGQMRENLYRDAGKLESGQRPNYFRQEVDDALNNALDRIKKSTHFWLHDVRQTSLSIVAGTELYALDDFCLMPIGFRTEGSLAHYIDFVNVVDVDRSGMRSPDIIEGAYGPYMLTFYPRRHTASKSGTCNVTENAATVTWVSGDTFASTDTGKRIRLNGDDKEYVFTYVSSTSGTLDRNYRGMLTGTSATGLSGNLVAGTFEISPPPVWQVDFEPSPSAAITVYYRYVHRWKHLLHADEVPMLDENWHYAMLLGAKAELHSYFKNPQNEATYEQKFHAAIERMRKSDWPIGKPGRVFYRNLQRGANRASKVWPADLDVGR